MISFKIDYFQLANSIYMDVHTLMWLTSKNISERDSYFRQLLYIIGVQYIRVQLHTTLSEKERYIYFMITTLWPKQVLYPSMVVW